MSTTSLDFYCGKHAMSADRCPCTPEEQAEAVRKGLTWDSSHAAHKAAAPFAPPPLFSNDPKPGSILYERERAARDADGADILERRARDAEAVAVRALGEAAGAPQQVGDVNSTARGSGARFNAGKVPFELIPLRLIAESYDPDSLSGDMRDACDALGNLGFWQETGDVMRLYVAMQAMGLAGWTDCAKVFDYGRKKYAEWNWAKGMKWSVPLACAARHLMQILDGETNDAESGLPHRGHVFCNIVMLLTFARTFPEGNDRPRQLATPEPAATTAAA